jgi:hypothetical protein
VPWSIGGDRGIGPDINAPDPIEPEGAMSGWEMKIIVAEAHRLLELAKRWGLCGNAMRTQRAAEGLRGAEDIAPS